MTVHLPAWVQATHHLHTSKKTCKDARNLSYNHEIQTGFTNWRNRILLCVCHFTRLYITIQLHFLTSTYACSQISWLTKVVKPKSYWETNIQAVVYKELCSCLITWAGCCMWHPARSLHDHLHICTEYRPSYIPLNHMHLYNVTENAHTTTSAWHACNGWMVLCWSCKQEENKDQKHANDHVWGMYFQPPIHLANRYTSRVSKHTSMPVAGKSGRSINKPTAHDQVSLVSACT